MSYSRPYPSPCETCTLTECKGVKCDPWRIRYLYRQKQINAYAKKIGLLVGKGRSKNNGISEST